MFIYKPENSPEYALIEIVEFSGRKYRRYPGASGASARRYFHAGKRSLHRDIYEMHFGKIPDGWHVHHMDRNPLNNHPANLEALPESEHLTEHAMSRSPEELKFYEENLAKHRHKAYAWHKTDEGRAWHEANRKANSERALSVPFREHTCKHCNKTFESRSKKEVVIFCSPKCTREHSKATGSDQGIRACGNCKAEFSTWKYGKVACCSISCSRHLEKAKRHAGLNYNGTPRGSEWTYKVVRNICGFCGEIYERTPRHPKTTYCSKICAARFRSMNGDDGTFVKCVECGISFGTRALKPASTCKSCKEAKKTPACIPPPKQSVVAAPREHEKPTQLLMFST